MAGRTFVIFSVLTLLSRAAFAQGPSRNDLRRGKSCIVTMVFADRRIIAS